MQRGVRPATRTVLARCALAAVLGASLLLGSTVSSAQTPRIAVSPSAVELDPGQSRTVQLTLSEPIIPADPEPGFVTITFSSSPPGRVELSDTSLTWTASDWHTTRTLTVSALPQGDQVGPDELVTVTGAVTSNAEFYSGATVSLDVTVNDPPPPSTAPLNTTTTTVRPTAPTAPAAPSSGSDTPAGAGLAISG